jgi:hypothetical protein
MAERKRVTVVASSTPRDVTKKYSSVRRITLVDRSASGGPTIEVHYERVRRKKKGTLGLDSIEDYVRRLTRADIAMEQSYLARHERSNAERADGWLLDLEDNLVNAARKGLNKLDKDADDDDQESEDDDIDLDEDDEDED